MEITFGVYLEYFFWSFALGAGLAFVYDGLRATRRMTRGSAWRVNLEDSLFFLLSGGLLFLIAFDKNAGQLRWQGFLGTFLGAGGYYLLFHNYVVFGMVWLTEGLIRIFVWLIRVLLVPVQAVYRILAKPFYVVVWYSRKKASRAKGALRAKRQAMQMRTKTKKAEKEKRKRQKNEKKQKEKSARKTRDIREEAENFPLTNGRV